MFVQLKNLLENAAGLTLTISASDAELQVVVSPKAAQGSNSGLVRPLVLKGTPEELDEGFVNALSGFIKTRQTLSDQLAAAQADMRPRRKRQRLKPKKRKIKRPRPNHLPPQNLRQRTRLLHLKPRKTKMTIRCSNRQKLVPTPRARKRAMSRAKGKGPKRPSASTSFQRRVDHDDHRKSVTACFFV